MTGEEPAAAPASGDSAFSRIAGVFFSPSRTFEAIARRPTWLAPLVLWTAVSLVVSAVLIPRIDYDKVIRQAMEKRGQTVPEERMASIVQSQQRIWNVVGWISAGVVPALTSLFVAVVIWGSFKAFGWDATYRQALGVTTHSFLPGVLGAILLIPLVARQEKMDPAAMGDLLRSNAGFLVERDAKALHSLLGSIDVFSFWSLVLLVIGFAAAAKIRRAQAAGVIVTLWAVFVLGKAGLAALF